MAFLLFDEKIYQKVKNTNFIFENSSIFHLLKLQHLFFDNAKNQNFFQVFCHVICHFDHNLNRKEHCQMHLLLGFVFKFS